MTSEPRLSNQALHAYAYLTASFRTQAQSADIIDCLLPFVSAAIFQNQTEPVDVERVGQNLASFGLEIPLYAIEQMLPRLQRDGVIEWNNIAKRLMPVASQAKGNAQFPQLPEAFDEIGELLAKYAEALNFERPPLSDNWLDALISFLKDQYNGSEVKAFKIDGLISSASPEIQSIIIGLFIQGCHEHNPKAFSAIEKIYTGIQIEDFIRNVQSLGQMSDYSDLLIFYDTSVLLRLLGTSGALLREATLEMHHTLQNLGAKTYYFTQNSNEVENILATLSSAYERGQEIYNETADALTFGEITIGEIRDFSGTFEARLSAINIFPIIYDYNSRKIEEKFQIDEISFSESLKSAAIRRERIYSVQNALNDAGAVNLVFRMRKGRPARDIGRSKAIFISRNSLLQRVARDFAIHQTDQYDESSIPPVLTTGQITTAAWLADSKALEPAKVSQELLARCYAAVQPSAEWAEEFGRALEQFKGENPEIVADRANSIIFLTAARKAARETTFNDPALLKKANTVEIFRRAAEEARIAKEERDQAEEARVLEIQAANSATLLAAKEAWEADARAKVEIEKQEALNLAEKNRQSHLCGRAEKFAKRFVTIFQLVCIFIMSITLVFGPNLGVPGSTVRVISLSSVLIITIFAICDLVGIPLIRRFFDSIRNMIKDKYVDFLSG